MPSFLKRLRNRVSRRPKKRVRTARRFGRNPSVDTALDAAQASPSPGISTRANAAEELMR